MGRDSDPSAPPARRLLVVDDGDVRYVFCAGLWWWLHDDPVGVWTGTGRLDRDLGSPVDPDTVLALELYDPGVLDAIWDALTGVLDDPAA